MEWYIESEDNNNYEGEESSASTLSGDKDETCEATSIDLDINQSNVERMLYITWCGLKNVFKLFCIQAI